MWANANKPFLPLALAEVVLRLVMVVAILLEEPIPALAKRWILYQVRV